MVVNIGPGSKDESLNQGVERWHEFETFRKW